VLGTRLKFNTVSLDSSNCDRLVSSPAFAALIEMIPRITGNNQREAGSERRSVVGVAAGVETGQSGPDRYL
jgi:hypothetical protein